MKKQTMETLSAYENYKLLRCSSNEEKELIKKALDKARGKNENRK